MLKAARSGRQTIIALLNGFAADAFEKKPTPEDITYLETELARLDAQIAKLTAPGAPEVPED